MAEESKQKIQRVISSLFVMLCFCSLPVHAKYGGGSGEPNDPYLIYTAEQMNEIGMYEDDWDRHFKLMSDIDLSAYKGTAFHIIGRFTPGSGPVGGRGRGGGDPDEWKPFTGVFDGNDHVISAFTYDCNGISIVALFRCVGGSFAEIRDLGLIDPNVHAEAGNEVGSLVGRLMEGGTVVDCYVEGGRIEGSWSAGGLVGSNYQGMIKACHSTASVSGNLSVGGMVGYSLEGTITHCYSHGNVWGDKRIGGLIGSNEGGKISVCYFSGPVSGSYEVGGLVGENEDGTITQCYSSGTVWGSEYIGGLVGSNYGWVNTSTASPDAILNCYSSSSVSGDDMVGGLVGAIMISSPAIGYPPGLPAFYESGPVTIRNCYATGSVVGDGTVGGLVGEGGAVCYCFWDTQTSGQTTSARGEGKTTNEMQTASTFFGWGGCGDEPIWTIDEGNDYPRLYWENKPGEILTVPPLSGLLLGSGTRDDPYLIHTPEELNLVAAALCDWDKCFRLMADIDLSGFSYEAALITPDRDKMALGFQGTPFSGVFDGNGHTISHLTIDGVSHIGLFGQLGSGAKITNLGLEVVDVNGSGDYVGGLVGQNFYDGSITTCYSAGTVSGESFWIGGLVGYNNGSITTCYSTGTVRGERSWVGGLVGVNNGSIATSYSAGTVTGNSDVGGLVGFNRDSVTTSYSTTAVTGDSSVGGLVGYNGGTVAMSYGIGPVTGNEEVGGLVGDDEGGKILTRPGSTGNTTSSFWNMETSGQTESAGGEGKTTTEMQTESTFTDAGWDFVDEVLNGTCDYWQISPDDYPRLCYPVMPEGLGTAQEPYLIRDTRDIGTVWFEPQAHYRLEASVDLTGITWFMPVVPWFCGTFDGEGHVIRNLHIQGSECLGLFGQLGSGAKISDLGLEAVDVNQIAGIAGITAVGGLVGNNDGGSISTCYSNGTVNGTGSLGGLVGSNSGTVSNCNSTSSISGTGWHVGGLVGSNGGNISNSYSTGTVSGGSSVGGLVGSNYKYINDGNIAASYSTGTVSGDSRVGGLVGDFGGPVYNSFWDVETSDQLFSAGGTGKTTVEMQTASTFLEAGWDFIDETANGTEDIWWILEGQDYPRLWWQYGQAFSPYPQDRAVDIPQPLILSWLPGGSSLQHDVYFGEDKEAVANAKVDTLGVYRGRQEPEMITYNPGNLELEKTYYWRIDEVNEDDPNSPWKGHVWSFTTVNYIVVDDFESYDAADNQIWFSWLDGLGYGMFGAERYYPGNGTGSCVGEIDWIEETIVRSGCQSMTYYYDNNKEGFAKYSEAEKTLSYPRDWTKDGVSELSLWFRGRPADVGSFVEGPVGTYTMTSSGTDIGGRSDQFHFAFKTLTGPGSIAAKVESIENTLEWAKAGVMIREELYGYSKHTFVYVTPNNGITFHGRIEWGKTNFSTNQTGISTPHWIKLVRDADNNFTAYHSSDGSEWKAIGEMQNIQMDTNVYIGLALTSHDSRIACEAKFSNVTMTDVVGAQWTHQDIGMDTNEIEPMYVVVANNIGKPVVVYHNDPSAAGINTWTEWVIPLQVLADQDIDLTDVNSIAIGFGDRNNLQPSGSGKMWFDDIRLYRPRPAASHDLEVNVP